MSLRFTESSEVKAKINEVLNLIFTQSFLTRALIVGILVSLCSALLGVSLVLKRFSMIGDGLSHVAFGAMAIACAANIAPLYFALPIVVFSAFLLLKMNESGKIKGDAAIALISTGALAVGVMATSITTGMNIDIYNYMFGSILTMTSNDVIISTVLSIIVITLFVIFYNEIFAVTFDESFAKATGTKTTLYNMLISALTAVTIVVGMRMIGALLISSLIIFPTVTSMRICKSFIKVIISSTLISVFCFISGLLLSVKYEAPTGASVVCFNIFLFAAFSSFKALNSKNLGGNKAFGKILSFAVAFVFALVYIAVMATGSAGSYTEKKNLSVVTTAFAQYDFAQNIVGEKGEVTMLLSPGEESHTFEPTPADIMKIKQCDVFVYGGGESEKWVDTILDSLGEKIKTVKMMEVVELFEENHDAHGEGDHIHEENHGETEYDEHVWTSPQNAVKITEAICEAVIEADNSNYAYYKNNTESYIEKLEELDRKFAEAVSRSQRHFIIIGDRFPLRYLTERYNIEFYSAFPGCSAQTEANPITISTLIDRANTYNIPIVFKVDLGTGKVAQTISEATGAQIRTLYSCHIVSAEDFGNGIGYTELMERNLDGILAALN